MAEEYKPMKRKHKVEIIVAIITALGAIVASGIGGISYGKELQNQYVQSQIANINGDNNTVTMNNVDDLIKNYLSLQEKYDSLSEQNDQHFDDYTAAKADNENLQGQLKDLEKQLKDSPIIQFKNLGLSINGDDIKINKTNSYALIDGAEYFSKDFINNLVDNSTSITIKDDVLYLGRVIAEKANLFDQRIIDSNKYEIQTNVTDSYGNIHASAARITDGSCGKVIYNLKNKYSLLKIKIAMSESSTSGKKCIISIKADGEPVYTSEKIEKSSQEIVEYDIPINNCSKLEIECTGDWYASPIIYDAEVYN